MSAWQRLTRPGTALVSGETDEGSRAVSTHVGQDVDFSAQQRTRCRQESELGQRRSNDGEVKDDIFPLWTLPIVPRDGHKFNPKNQK